MPPGPAERLVPWVAVSDPCCAPGRGGGDEHRRPTPAPVPGRPSPGRCDVPAGRYRGWGRVGLVLPGRRGGAGPRRRAGLRSASTAAPSPTGSSPPSSTPPDGDRCRALRVVLRLRRLLPDDSPPPAGRRARRGGGGHGGGLAPSRGYRIPVSPIDRTTRWSTSRGTTLTAYCAWSGTRLPSRGGMGGGRPRRAEGSTLPRGDQLEPGAPTG